MYTCAHTQGDRIKLTQHMRTLTDHLPVAAGEDNTIFDFYPEERLAGELKHTCLIMIFTIHSF